MDSGQYNLAPKQANQQQPPSSEAYLDQLDASQAPPFLHRSSLQTAALLAEHNTHQTCIRGILLQVCSLQYLMVADSS